MPIVPQTLWQLWGMFCGLFHSILGGKTDECQDPEEPPLPPSPILNHGASDPDTSATPPIFALTIGIDSYLHSGLIFANLSGCVADADDIVDLLLNTFHVPQDHITDLRNEEATGKRIAVAFESLAMDARIPKGASIFIFYAGHGSEALPPKDWPSNDMIQTLMPYDFDPGSLAHPVTRNGLADIKLAQFLEHLANEKGNNITVVFDSCHSGSSTRSSSAGTMRFVARGVELPRGTELGADAFSTSRGSVVLPKDRNKALGSHVLLAACTELQSAHESNGRGLFTSALTKLLRSEDLKQLTYSDIVHSIPALPRKVDAIHITDVVAYIQNPQCEGINQDLTFLRNHTPSRRQAVHSVIQSEESIGVYVIDAGEARGVTFDAEFAVYDATDCINELGRLVVVHATAFESRLRPAEDGATFNIPSSGAFAIQTRIGNNRDVRLLIEGTANCFTDIQEILVKSTSIKVVHTLEGNPDLILTVDKGTAHIEITDKICRDAGLYTIPYHPAIDRETMQRTLPGVASFYRNLHLATSGKHIIAPMIGFECHELDLGGYGAYDAMKPTGDNLCVDGLIQIGIGDEEKPYGFRINNTSALSLFVSVFYFNMSDLSIIPYYQPPSAGARGHFKSIPPKGFLTIGYGPGGSQPHTFYLNEDENVDVGYLKLFFSTEYVNYSEVPQVSPFLPEGRFYGEVKSRHHLWDTVLIPIIQRREKA